MRKTSEVGMKAVYLQIPSIKIPLDTTFLSSLVMTSVVEWFGKRS
jgi:hypothetical protein